MPPNGRVDHARVLIADDDEGARTFMRDLFELDGFETVTAACGRTALAAARAERPALALLDINLPQLCGYEVCDALRRLYGDSVAIIFVSGERVESFDRVAGLLVGADDYVVKPFAPDELLGRARTALRRVNPNGAKASALTKRERQVLALLADGLEQREIAERLVISTKTVSSHIERILAKLGVRSRAQAVALAFRDKLVQV